MEAVENQELGRYLTLLLSARAIGSEDAEARDFYADIERFWAEIRVYPLDSLLESKALHLIPYLAHPRDGFVPWESVRAYRPALPLVWDEVADFLPTLASATADAEAGFVKLVDAMKAIGGRINDRQTWCAAMEVCSVMDRDPIGARALLESWR